MVGAREYANLFEKGQYGRLYIVPGSHARGRTFRIQVLPEGEKARPNGGENLCLNPDAVTVYGVVGGRPGWTESYGWMHNGPWVQDFEAMVAERRSTLESESAQNSKRIAEIKEERLAREKELLSSYRGSGQNTTEIPATVA